MRDSLPIALVRANPRRAASVALLVLCLTFVAPAGAQAPAMACPPPTPPAPEGAPAPSSPPVAASEAVLVCVGSQSITGATFLHWAAVARKTEEPASKHPRATESEVLTEVMSFLISSDWVQGEASNLGIAVSEAFVRHTFDHIRAQQFPKHREFARFLKRSGQTVADLMLRVRLNLLSQRIQKSVLAGHHSELARQRALKRFLENFKVKWMAQTYCLPAYAVQDCGHEQASL